MGLADRVNREVSKLKMTSEFIYIFAPCGKYLCLIQIYKEKKNGTMMFFDNKNIDEVAKQNSMLVTEPFRNEFMEEYERMKPYYSINYDAAELSDDASPLNSNN